MSDFGNAVFLSYASQDVDAAKRICEALRAAGVEVWFDQSELVGGDAWDAKIRGQISSCALFMPVISAATQARLEGYFRLEWKLAAQRTHTMADEKTFLLPVLIDGTRDAEAKVPAEFKTVQWTKLPGGETPAAFCERVKRLLSGTVAGVADPGLPGSASPATSRPALLLNSRPWLAPVIAGGVIALLALILARPWEKAAPPAEPSAPRSAPTTSESTESVSEARQLARRAFAPVEHGTPSREQLITAEALCDRALTLDSTDPEIWTIAARIDVRFIQGNFDTSAARRERAISRAARVIGLAPDLFESRLTRAYVLDSVATTDAMRADAEAQLLALLKERPDDPTTLALLANLARKAGRFAASGEYYDRSGSPGGAAWSYYFGEDFDRAAEAAERSLRKGVSPAMITLKAILAEVQREDVEAARAIFREIPASALLEEGPAYNAVRFALHARRPDEVIQILGALPMEYLSSAGFSGPKALLTGKAHELAGRPEAARADWQLALGVMGKKLALNPNDPQLLLEKAEVLAWLGDTPEAENTLRLAAQLAGTAPDEITVRTLPLHVRLGHRDAVLAFLTRKLAARENGWRVMHAYARYDPDYDPLRGDPRFEKLLRETLPEGAKPFEGPETKDQRPGTTQASSPRPQTPDPGPSDRPLVDQKSVAVLAFANLSDDKANEYFSDGISEELLNVLAKVPGLKVSARTSAFFFKGKEVPVPEIARQLGVAYVVEGSVRKQGDRVRITAQLIKAADGFHVWSDTFTRDLKDIFAVQDEIAGLIAQNLELKMGMKTTGPRLAVSPEAYQAFLEGRAAAARAGQSDMRAAVTHFERAVAAEPKYTAAWVQLARTHTQLGRWGGAPPMSSWAAARAAINRALALEPDAPEAQQTLGWILRTGEWNWREAEKTFRRALQLQPNQPDILAGTAVLLFNIGQTEEAFRLGRQAAQLDPLNAATQMDLGLMFYFSGNPAEAERAVRRALQLAPDGTNYHGILGWCLIAQERLDEAEPVIARESDEVERTNATALLAVARGQGSRAREQLARMEEIARTRPDTADLQMNIAWINARLGDKDAAFAALEKARASRDPSMAWLRSTDLKSLYSDPRWNELLRKIGLADEQLK